MQSVHCDIASFILLRLIPQHYHVKQELLQIFMKALTELKYIWKSLNPDLLLFNILVNLRVY